MKRLVLVLALALSGCGHVQTEPVIEKVIVKVPMPVSCVPANVPDATPYPDTDAALRPLGMAERLQLLILGRDARKQRLDVLEPVIGGCKVPPSS